MTNSTYQPKAKEIVRFRHFYDADKKVLGRLASEIATKLIGKHKKTYSTHLDSGDFVIVVNAEKVTVTGKKEEDKIYYSHSGYPGGLKQRRLWEMREKNPRKIIELAVRRMLPKNRLQADRMARFKVFVGENHPYGSRVEELESRRV